MLAGLDYLGAHTDGLPSELLSLLDGPLQQLLPGGVEPDLPWDRLSRARTSSQSNKSSDPIRCQRFNALKFLAKEHE